MLPRWMLTFVPGGPLLARAIGAVVESGAPPPYRPTMVPYYRTRGQAIALYPGEAPACLDYCHDRAAGYDILLLPDELRASCVRLYRIKPPVRKLGEPYEFEGWSEVVLRKVPFPTPNGKGSHPAQPGWVQQRARKLAGLPSIMLSLHHEVDPLAPQIEELGRVIEEAAGRETSPPEPFPRMRRAQDHGREAAELDEITPPSPPSEQPAVPKRGARRAEDRIPIS